MVKADSENVSVYKAKLIIMKWKDKKDMSEVQPKTNN
jgi:hypothetical protein